MRIQAPLRGMSCAGCARRIEEAARRVPGVSSVEVHFAAETIVLETDDRFRAASLQKTLRDLGYRLAPPRRTFRVRGLDPAAASALEGRIRSLPGVLAAAVHYAGSTVTAESLREGEVEELLRREGLHPEPEEIRSRDPEIRDLTVRALPAAVLSAAVVTLGMTGTGPPWLWMALTLPVQFWAGWPFHRGMLRSLRRLSPDMNTLVSIGTNAAFFYSLFSTDPRYDTSAAIISVVLIGRLLELRARRAARRAIESLLELLPSDPVRPGQELWVKPGERVPADGIVLEGHGALDEAMFTGEPLPVSKGPGDRVIGGSLNTDGAFRVRFERTGEDTLLARIVRMVRQAQASKTPAQRLADLWAGRFVPIVLALSLATFGVWLAVGPFPRALAHAVSVLVVACPCAFGLATPMAVMVALARAARGGILIKEASVLEALGTLEVMVLDKTGTLTEGRPSVAGVIPAPGFEPEGVLRPAASVERLSEHPLARAIAAAVPEAPPAAEFRSHPGLGTTGRVDGTFVAVGSPAFLASLGVSLAPLKEALDSSSAAGKPLVAVASGGVPAGLILLEDAPRPDAAPAVEALKKLGLRIRMITGDGAAAARSLADRLGIDEWDAGLLPHEKAGRVQALQESGVRVAAAGDGVNDAPALARADVGIAVSRGTDVAIETADVVLVKNDLRRLAEAVRLGRAARRVIHQNFGWAFGYNALLIPLAAGVAAPLGLSLDPVAAAAAMALSSITVVLNSLRLARLPGEA